jgi:ABC-type polysaccharide/polyol phosphate transport system ATPase subunit
MDKDLMVKVDNVSMRFNLGIEKNYSIKQFVVESFSPTKRRMRKSQKQKNEFWALKNISFDVKRGEVIGFVGANGAGKSTLLKIVAGVMKPTSGTVEVGGNICPMIELGAGFDSDLTARENVYLNGSVMGYNKKFLDGKYDEIVDFSDLHDFMEVPVKNFSSGMVARLAFSIATIVDPEILIVDEILSVGDAAFRQKSEHKMKNMITGGTTVLYVSHSTESIKALCDRVVWIDHGAMKMIGDPETVCNEYLSSLNLL